MPTLKWTGITKPGIASKTAKVSQLLMPLVKSLRIIARAGEEWGGVETLVVALGARQQYLRGFYNGR